MNSFNLFAQPTTKEDFEYILYYMGNQITINGQLQRALITNTSLNRNYDDRKITTLVPLHRGDIVEFNGNKYMIISQVNDTRYDKYKAIMRRLTHEIVFNFNCKFVTSYGYIEASQLDLIEGRIMSLPSGQIKVFVPQNSVRDVVKTGNRFIIEGQPFRIDGVDAYTQPGIVILTCQIDQIRSEDDVTNDIAGLFGCKIDITTQETELQIGQTLILEYSATGNTPVAFVSSNPEIATVDENGVVTAVSEGKAVITVFNSTMEIIKDTIEINVVPVQSTYTISITSSASNPDEIKYAQSKTYQAQVFLNGNLVEDQPVIWQLFADDQVSPTTLATITSQDGHSCTVKNNNANSGFVQLKATLQSDSRIFAWKRIQMKPLF